MATYTVTDKTGNSRKINADYVVVQASGYVDFFRINEAAEEPTLVAHLINIQFVED